MTTILWTELVIVVAIASHVFGWWLALRSRPTLGTGALARECDEQRSRADKAEALLTKAKRILHGIDFQ